MKKITFLLGVLCLLVSFTAQAQYDNIQTWGQKLYYNGSDYPNSFMKFKIAVANPRISGTGGKVVFYDSDTYQYNTIEVKSVSQASDARLKTNINPLNNGLGAILGLKPVSFNWKNESSQLRSSNAVPTKSLGFLAQDVEKVLPEIVSLSSTGDSLVDYTAIIPVLVQAVKDLDGIVQQLELQLDEKANIADIQGTTVRGLLTTISSNNGIQEDSTNQNITSSFLNNNSRKIEEINLNGEEYEVNQQNIAALKEEIIAENYYKVEFEKNPNTGAIYRVVITPK